METAATRLREEGRLIGLREGRQEGRQEGQIKTLQRTIIVALETRFGSVPTTLERKIKRVQDLARLQTLFAATLTTTSLTTFEQGLD